MKTVDANAKVENALFGFLTLIKPIKWRTNDVTGKGRTRTTQGTDSKRVVFGTACVRRVPRPNFALSEIAIILFAFH